MRSLLSAVVFPVLLALASLVVVQKRVIRNNIFPESAIDTTFSDRRYVYNFNSIPEAENLLLTQPADSSVIYLLGSSELTSGNAYTPYNFISDRFPVKVMGIGHEGNQCFSIYCQLLANSNRLKNAPVVIIVSPGWFEAKPARGTTSAVFLQYVSDEYVRKIQKSKVDPKFVAYANKGIAGFYHELNAPSSAYRIAHLRDVSSRSYYHSVWAAPLQEWNVFTDFFKQKIAKVMERPPVFSNEPVMCTVNWDSLRRVTREVTISKATNNEMGIENEYFSTYIQQKKGNIYPIPRWANREMDDFSMLVDLLHHTGANASFIISPLNPYYFKNLNDLNPVIEELETKMKSSGFTYLNLFTSEPKNYDKALLSDVMHMSEYGWLQVDEFIVHRYSLCK